MFGSYKKWANEGFSKTMRIFLYVYVHLTRILNLTCYYLNNIEDYILVEAVQNALGDSVIVPGTMHHQ